MKLEESSEMIEARRLEAIHNSKKNKKKVFEKVGLFSTKVIMKEISINLDDEKND
jgi:hypothetical protein